MDAYTLMDALTDVREGFLEETEAQLRRKKRRRAGSYLLAAALIALLSVTTAMAVDADFRGRVLSLFTVAETVPGQPSDSGKTVALSEGVTASYIFVPDYAHIEGGMFMVCADDVALRQGSRYGAYVYEDGALVEQEEQHFDQVYTQDGQTYHLRFDWVAHDGQAAITWAPALDDIDGGEWQLRGGTQEAFRVTLGERVMALDLHSGALTPLPPEPDYRADYQPAGTPLYAGEHLALEANASGGVTLVDMGAMARTIVADYTLPDAAADDIWYVENPSGTRLAVVVRGGEDWSIRHLAVLGGEECFLLERDSAPSAQEDHLQWLDDDRFVIPSHPETTQPGTWFYFYNLREG